jgi:short-subunit dehydrogenase
MTQRTWMIIGATSIIAEKFAHLTAQLGHRLILVGRQKQQLNIIAQDLKIRYQIQCELFIVNLEKMDGLLNFVQEQNQELDLFIAHSDFTYNEQLNVETITQLIKVNILASALLIHTYFNRPQNEYNLLFLSSVAACRGRSKNSLYGGSKASIEIYLEGLQQARDNNHNISIARLGYIDTKQTYGLPGIFYAAKPEACAKACWIALRKRKKIFYYPFFWRIIMGIISRLPFFIYKRLGSL